jgi:FADH2 O2-dependent halogenase
VKTRTDTDVIILGSGLAGSIAALCLQRQGLEVTLIDQGTHPRFALGESTTTPSSLWLRLLAEKFGVPELLNIASAESLTRFVAPTSGVKNNFGFLYHRAGEDRPECAWQAIIPQAHLSEYEHEKQPAYNEMHYFRQDVDAWLWFTALAEGVTGRSATRVERVDFDDQGVAVALSGGGETLRGRFLIDASGYRSPVAAALDLRDPLPRMRTNSRTMFTHMIGVQHFEDLKAVPDSMAPWSQGTLHHFFDGGWLWVIPFDNHVASRNRLCSVGLSFDNRRYPKPEGRSVEAEWTGFLERFPGIGRQFRDAVPVRPWVATRRLQYSSRQCVGDRWFLTSHATGAVDALYSMGNINTFQTLATGLSLVLQACAEDSFDRDRLQPLQEVTESLLHFQDSIVYGSYVSFRAPELLKTWIALWSLTDTARIRRVLMPLVKFARTRDQRHLEFCVEDPATILTGIGMRTEITDTPTVLRELDGLCDIMQVLEEGEASVEAVAVRLDSAVRGMQRYHIDLDAMEEAFTRIPWTFEPLARNSLRGYGNCFLTPHELNTLGVDE